MFVDVVDDLLSIFFIHFLFFDILVANITITVYDFIVVIIFVNIVGTF